MDGVDLPAPAEVPAVRLGGAVASVPTDGILMHEIVDPSAHYVFGIAKDRAMRGDAARMPDTSSEVTVRQLADIVAFLQAHDRQLPRRRR